MKKQLFLCFNFSSSFFLLAFVVGVCACQSEKKRPLTDDQLIGILSDIHIAEAAIAKQNSAAKDTTAARLYKQICTIHKVNQSDVDSCLAILKKDPALMEKLYGKVLEELEKRTKNLEPKTKNPTNQ